MGYDLDHFLGLARVSGLAVSADGRRAAVSVATVSPKGTSMRSAIWAVDPTGDGAPPRQLTRSAKGDSAPVFLPDGSMLFVSGRPDPDATDADDDSPGGLWRLPASGGEAALVWAPGGGVEAVVVSADGSTVIAATELFAASTDLAADDEFAAARKKAGVSAQLFDTFPIRLWDHYLGPRQRRFFASRVAADGTFGPWRQVYDERGGYGDGEFAVAPDGSTLYVTVGRRGGPRDLAFDLIAVNVRTGRARPITTGPYEFQSPAVSPDGRWVVCVRVEIGEPGRQGDQTLWLIPTDATKPGEGRDLTPGFDLWPLGPTWLADSSGVVFGADEAGYAPLFSVSLRAKAKVETVAGGAAYHAPHPCPDGSVVALRSHVGFPAEVCRIACEAGRPGEAAPVASPGGRAKTRGRLVDVDATATDGTRIRSWLVLPPGASRKAPAPLVVWVHGGPVGSWNDWSWRWNPWLLAERGYAVLLPDPAMSTGYGVDFVARSQGRWGEEAYTDVIAAADAACARADIDATRTALMGGSFGGYMANWVAGHTDRFRCIVTHASLWCLDQFHGTTDGGPYWEPWFGNPYVDNSKYLASSPHLHVGEISTPMLVVHGELDYRVPIGEGLRLWTDLQMHGVESKFLYFPDENHWVLKPQNARVWYETVFAWLDQHVLGEPWQQPSHL